MVTENNNIVLSRVDYLILSVLKDENAISPLTAMSTNEIVDDVDLNARSSIHKHLAYILQNNYINFGGKFGRQNTYYITKEGIELLGGNK